MPIHTSFDHPQHLALVTFEGAISEEELMAHIQEMVSKPEHHIEYDKVIDLRNCRMEIARGRQKFISQQSADIVQIHSGRIAILSSNQQQMVHSILFARDIADSNKIRVFPTPHSAFNWLGKEATSPNT